LARLEDTMVHSRPTVICPPQSA